MFNEERFVQGFTEELEKISAQVVPADQQKKKPGLLSRAAKGALIGGAAAGIPTGGALAIPGALTGAGIGVLKG